MFYNRPYTLVEIIWTSIKAKRKHNKFVINAIKFETKVLDMFRVYFYVVETTLNI